MMKFVWAFLCLLCLSHTALIAHHGFTNGDLHKVQPKAGDGITTLLLRYELLSKDGMKAEFLRLNQLKNSSALHLDKKYKLPVALYRYNGQSIRSTIGINDWDKASRIKAYNETLLKKRVRSTHYTASNILWVPLNELGSRSDAPSEKVIAEKTSKKAHHTPAANTSSKHGTLGADIATLIGKEHKLNTQNNNLNNTVFYIVSGHGGPDPGAVCSLGSRDLHEDEYAYDVSLRLAKELKERGAIVEMVVQDKNDGIRDAKILARDSDERMANGDKLSINQLKRLQQRTSYINKKYTEYQKKGIRDQAVLSLHVDSNSASHKTDVFFCYYKKSNSSKRLAATLMDKFEEKYNFHQKNRGYKGYLNQRNFYVLRKTAPPAVLIELANIQNKHNHKRILQSGNRQALAKWIAEGLEEKYGERILAQR